MFSALKKKQTSRVTWLLSYCLESLFPKLFCLCIVILLNSVKLHCVLGCKNKVHTGLLWTYKYHNAALLQLFKFTVIINWYLVASQNVLQELYKGNNFHPEILLIRNYLIFLHIKTYQKPVQGRERERDMYLTIHVYRTIHSCQRMVFHQRTKSPDQGSGGSSRQD